MSRLSELQQQRMKMRRQQHTRRMVFGFVMLFLLIVNIVLLGLQFYLGKNSPEKGGTVAAKPQETQETADTEAETTVPAEDEPETDTVKEAETEDETEAPEPVLSGYELDPNYVVLENYDDFAFVLPGVALTNIYEKPSKNSRIIGKGRCYSGLNILSSSGNYYKVGYKDGEGYILKDDVRIGEEAEALALEYVHCVAELLYDKDPIYIEPDESSKVVVYEKKEKTYEIKKDLGEWLKIDNTINAGYIRKNRVDIIRSLDESYFFINPGEKISDLRLEILDYACKWFGHPYVWGGEDLATGVDCSAFVMRVFEKFSIPMPRLSQEQSEWGTEVKSMDDILPGDLLFYRGYNDATKTYTDGVGHVAIYMGNGYMIHAASEERGIVIDKYDYSDEPVLCIRRVIKE